MQHSPYFLPVTTPSSAASFLLSQKGSGNFVLTLNIEMIARALIDPDFARIIQATPFRICDSIGAKLIGEFYHPTSTVSRITGVDVGSSILSLCAREQIPVFLLGGKEGVAERAKDRLCQIHAELPVVGTAHGYFSQTDLPALRGAIHRSGARVVFVCLGSPLQERWIIDNRAALPNVELFLPLGGSLDVWAGNLCRAPMIWRKTGTEWLFRILTAPHKGERIARLSAAVRTLGINRSRLGELMNSFGLNYVESDNRV